MPVGAQGSNAKLYFKQETVEAQAPTGNYQQLPFLSFGMTEQESLTNRRILSLSGRRSQSDPDRDVINVAGDVRLPLDAARLGHWFKMLLGAPVSTGTTNLTHVFKDGGVALPSNAFEVAYTDRVLFEQFLGVYANTMTLPIAPTGPGEITFGMIGLKGSRPAASGAGTPTAPGTLPLLFNRQASISYAGSALSPVTGGQITFTNNLAAVPLVGSGVYAGGIDQGDSAPSGSLQVRYASNALYDAAANGTFAALTYTLTIDANTSMEIHLPRISLGRPTRTIDGPTGIECTHAFLASDDATQACAMRVTLKNQIVSY